ncbi:hypothetical protein DITRI_Ditri18aG0008500 [Diplodiscus trichospermus]
MEEEQIMPHEWTGYLTFCPRRNHIEASPHEFIKDFLILAAIAVTTTASSQNQFELCDWCQSQERNSRNGSSSNKSSAGNETEIINRTQY